MAEFLTHAELDAKLAAAEARTDTKFETLLRRIEVGNSELRSEIRDISTRLGTIERSTRGLHATIIGTAIVAVGVIVGILAFGQQWFGIGVTTRDIVRATVNEMTLQQPPQPPQQQQAP